MVTMVSAGVVVFRKKNGGIEYLLLRNVKGHWDFPKGKIEDGESSRIAALRELKEEAGITAKILDGFAATFDFMYTRTGGQKVHKTVDFFVGEAASYDITVSREHTDSIWLPFEQAVERLGFEEQKNLLKEVNEFLTHNHRN